METGNVLWRKPLVNVLEWNMESSVETKVNMKGFLRSTGKIIRFVLFTPSWSSKRRAEQRAYEDRLDEAMRRSQSEQ